MDKLEKLRAVSAEDEFRSVGIVPSVKRLTRRAVNDTYREIEARASKAPPQMKRRSLAELISQYRPK